ncbi:hypothetical protein K7432_011070 [Basidiobolus ranarum]
MSPNLSHGIAYRALPTKGLTWRQMFQNHWRSLQSWSKYAPKSLFYQLPFCASKFGPKWKHLIQSNISKEFRYVSRRLIEDHVGGLVGYGGCVNKEQYNILILSKNDWKLQGDYCISIEGEERVELIAVNAKRGIFAIAYGNDRRGNEWNKIQVYRMDNFHDTSLLVEFRTQIQATFYYGNFDVPFGCNSDPNMFTLFAIEAFRESSMVILRFDYLTGELITKRYYNQDIQVLNYHPAKADNLLFGTTTAGDVYIWNLLADEGWRVMTNSALEPWGTEPTILFNQTIDKQAIKMITVGDNEVDSNYLLLWELQRGREEKHSTQQARLVYQAEVQSRDGVFGSYCVHGPCFLGLTYDGTIMVYHLENLRKLASIPIPGKYDFCTQLSPEELYDISVNDVGQIIVCTSQGLFILPLPASNLETSTIFMVNS